MKQIARQVKDPVPQSITSNDDTTNELLGYVEDAAGMIFNDFDWQVLNKTGCIDTHDGLQTVDLPSDFDSMTSYGIYDKTHCRVITAETMDERWERIVRNVSADDNKFAIQQNAIVFTAPFREERKLFYTYKSTGFVKTHDTAGNIVYTDTFANDGDEFVLNPHLLIQGAIAVRSVNLQLADSALRMQRYELLLEKRKNKDCALLQSVPYTNPDKVITTSKIMGVR